MTAHWHGHQRVSPWRSDAPLPRERLTAASWDDTWLKEWLAIPPRAAEALATLESQRALDLMRAVLEVS